MNKIRAEKEQIKDLNNSKVKIAYEDGDKVSTKHVKLKKVTPNLLLYIENTETEAMPLKRVIRIRKKNGGKRHGENRK